ncbi:helix-turn-helix transcriptional regulator [Aquimarina sp. U1-2]|uniref:helix-turn-helix domain-containing protein n=1 Tax=Aquimarina sp. U1-2 TaxID=2823141 RepID=UPI001AECD20E|nr:AraC family transcriptional regulator [Aquimarina sp. U1-2]MBP2830698.1 helix-turn-helix transcriptional regulator [Aquimarina sp. U1-2]
MKLYLKYDINKIFRKILEEQLDKIGVHYKINRLGEVEFNNSLSSQTIKELTTLLSIYGIDIINDHKSEIVQRIKDAITEMINDSSIERQFKTSTYLSESLGYSYTYLSNIFSESTYTSIESFVILKRIDRAKSLILENRLTLTEVAYTLGYSSVAHLSGQFKKTTGLTPTSFQRIIKERNKELNTL